VVSLRPFNDLTTSMKRFTFASRQMIA